MLVRGGGILARGMASERSLPARRAISAISGGRLSFGGVHTSSTREGGSGPGPAGTTLKHKYPAAQPEGAMGLELEGTLDRDELHPNEAHARAAIANVPIECEKLIASS